MLQPCYLHWSSSSKALMNQCHPAALSPCRLIHTLQNQLLTKSLGAWSYPRCSTRSTGCSIANRSRASAEEYLYTSTSRVTPA